MNVLMIVDMQKGFINDNNEHLMKRINELLSMQCFDSYIYTMFRNSPYSPFVNILGWDKMQEESEQEFAVFEEEPKVIFKKNTYALNQVDIDKLKEQKIKEIHLCGTDIDACILAIGFQLFDNGIKPILLKEYCGTSSSNKNLIESTLLIWERSFGKSSIDDYTHII